MTADEKKAAVKAAMEKRGNIAQKSTKDDSVASSIKAEKDKRTGGKKQKNHGNEATLY